MNSVPLKLAHGSSRASSDVPRRQSAVITLLGALLATLPAVASDYGHGVNPDRGESLYARCLGCHSLARNRTGPKHCGLVGRIAGSVAGFNYSDAMRKLRIVWTRKNLDRFLAAPITMVPGTTMGYSGIVAAADRRDLIAYIERASRSSVCAPRGGREKQ